MTLRAMGDAASAPGAAEQACDCPADNERGSFGDGAATAGTAIGIGGAARENNGRDGTAGEAAGSSAADEALDSGVPVSDVNGAAAAEEGLDRGVAGSDGTGSDADDGAGEPASSRSGACVGRRSGSLRMLEGASGFGKRSATSSRACRTHLPRAAASSSRWLLGDSTGLSTRATESVIRPLASSANRAGNLLASRASSMRRHASSSLMPNRTTQ